MGGLLIKMGSKINGKCMFCAIAKLHLKFVVRKNWKALCLLCSLPKYQNWPSWEGNSSGAARLWLWAAVGCHPPDTALRILKAQSLTKFLGCILNPSLKGRGLVSRDRHPRHMAAIPSLTAKMHCCFLTAAEVSFGKEWKLLFCVTNILLCKEGKTKLHLNSFWFIYCWIDVSMLPWIKNMEPSEAFYANFFPLLCLPINSIPLSCDKLLRDFCLQTKGTLAGTWKQERRRGWLCSLWNQNAHLRGG